MHLYLIPIYILSFLPHIQNINQYYIILNIDLSLYLTFITTFVIFAEKSAVAAALALIIYFPFGAPSLSITVPFFSKLYIFLLYLELDKFYMLLFLLL